MFIVTGRDKKQNKQQHLRPQTDAHPHTNKQSINQRNKQTNK